jgi:hypothetical protein
MTIKFIVKDDQDFTKRYEVAAWWTKIRVAAGEYEARPMLIGGQPCELENAYWVCVSLPGTVTDEYMPSLFGGVAYGAANRPENIGREENAGMQLYGYQVRDAIANGHENWRIA